MEHLWDAILANDLKRVQETSQGLGEFTPHPTTSDSPFLLAMRLGHKRIAAF